jgi:DNA-binding MarR family transcriptional regulator
MEDPLILARKLLQIIPPVMQTLAAELRKTGQLLSPSQFGVMVALHYHPCNLSELAEYQGVSLPTMSSTITRLEENGLVKRTRDVSDRRVVMVGLTSSGIEKLAQISDLAETRIGSMLNDLSTDNKKSLADGLEILCKIFDLDEMIDDSGDELTSIDSKNENMQGYK